MKASFEVFTKKGNLKPHLKRAFLEVADIDRFNALLGRCLTKNKERWQLICEPEAFEALIISATTKEKAPIKCILSCQEDWEGNKIAVARLYKEPNKEQSKDLDKEPKS